MILRVSQYVSPGAVDTPIVDGQFKTTEEAGAAKAALGNYSWRRGRWYIAAGPAV